MSVNKRRFFFGLTVLFTITLTACGGGGGGSGGTDSSGGATATVLELRDPTPGRDDYFGSYVVILSNGNVVVSDPGDSSIADANGAVHLYNPLTRALIASVYGDQADDQLGLHGITGLGNSNFVICSMVDNSGVTSNAGSARLVDGSSGIEIQALVGDQANDLLCKDGITALGNNNYVISSGLDDNGSVRDAGSVRLVDGTTGNQIAVLEGDQSFERFGLTGGVTVLSNDNYVVATLGDDEGGLQSVGSVRLFDGTTGAQINALIGDSAGDPIGTQVVVLANNNYVVASKSDDNGLVLDTGSIRLMNGATGNQISVVFGDDADDFLGGFITGLSNSNYVITSKEEDKDGISKASSVRLMNGSTGVQISVLFGDLEGDALGQRIDDGFIAHNAVTALSNNNYVITSPSDDNGAIIDAGSVRLMDGTTGIQIGGIIFGDQEDDKIGESGVTVLSNDNYVIASSRDDNGLILDAGSVQLVSGTTGDAVGPLLIGETSRNRLANGGVSALGNNNYVVASGEDNNGTVSDTGSIRLFNGSTGEQINALFGDGSSALLGLGLGAAEKVINVLGNNNFVVLSPFNNNGSIRLVNGGTGVQTDRINAEVSSDLGAPGINSDGTTTTSVRSSITAPADSSYYLIGAPEWDNGERNAGLVRMVLP
jgi:hypothetical protein